MAMFNAPLITVEVGRMYDGRRSVHYQIRGLQPEKISRALEDLGFVFSHAEDATGTVVFRGKNETKAWYTQVKPATPTDHNPTEETP